MDVRKIKGAMAEKSITQNDLAKLLNISSKAVSMKLNEKVDFKLAEAQKICQILDLQPDIFFTPRVPKMELRT